MKGLSVGLAALGASVAPATVNVCNDVKCIGGVKNFQRIPDFCERISGAEDIDPEMFPPDTTKEDEVRYILDFIKKSGIDLSLCGGPENVVKACRCLRNAQYPPSDDEPPKSPSSSGATSEASNGTLKTSTDVAPIATGSALANGSSAPDVSGAGSSSAEASEDTSSSARTASASTEASKATRGSTKMSEYDSSSTKTSKTTSSSTELSKDASNSTEMSKTTRNSTETSNVSNSTKASKTTSSSTELSKNASNSTEASKTTNSSTEATKAASSPPRVSEAASSSPEAAKNASSSAPETAKATVSASNVSSAPQPTPLRPVDVEILRKLSLQFKFQIQNGFCAITYMPAEAAKYNWRLVVKYNVNISQRYRWELCEPEDHGRVVTEFNGQLIYGSILDVSSDLLVENGGLFNIEIKQNTTIKIESASRETVQSKQREIVSCESLTSCQTRKCVDKECDVKLVVSYSSKLSISSSTSVAIVTDASFQPCSQEECNYIQKCTDKCVVEKAAPGPAPPVAPTSKVTPNTLSAVMNVNAQTGPFRQPTTSGGDVARKPVEQKRKGADFGSPSVQAPVSVYDDGEECVVTVQTSTRSQPATQGGPVERPKDAIGGSSPVSERPKEDLGVSRPTQRPKGDSQQPKEASDGAGTKQGPQNDGMEPATGPQKTPSGLGVEVETSETKSAVTHGALTEPNGQPQTPQRFVVSPGDAGSTPSTGDSTRSTGGSTPGNGGSTPGIGGSAPSRPQAPSAPSRANDTTTPSRDRAGKRPGEPVTITSGSTCTAIGGNVLAVVAVIAVLL